tara:strand:+ start:35 stop:499 length:465 start_codon:yes stop_codon:yes gene_type:complete
MSQRVNIQYSVNIEELPSELDRLSKLIDSELKQLSSMALADGDEEVDISLQSIFNINEIRSKIASIDHSLLDVANIMNGYINYLTTPEKQEDENTENQEVESELYPATEVNAGGKLDELESKLQQFKSNSVRDTYDTVASQKSEFSKEVPKTTA